MRVSTRHPELRALLVGLDDMAAVQVLADFLEERGDERAFVVRLAPSPAAATIAVKTRRAPWLLHFFSVLVARLYELRVTYERQHREIPREWQLTEDLYRRCLEADDGADEIIRLAVFEQPPLMPLPRPRNSA
jgi:hypothetical protein